LALSPGGECVLCRRRSNTTELAATSVWFRPAPWIALVGFAAISVTAAGAFYYARLAPEGVAAAPSPPPPAASAPVRRELVARPHAPAVRAPEREPTHATAIAAGAPHTNEPASAAEERAEEDRAEEERAEAEAIARASRRVSIVMYSTSWCPACDRARAWFNAQGISFVERDVDASDIERTRQRRLNPSGSVPTIAIDDREVLVGFSPAAITAAIDTAARRRAQR
jgi:glutaredoxin